MAETAGAQAKADILEGHVARLRAVLDKAPGSFVTIIAARQAGGGLMEVNGHNGETTFGAAVATAFAAIDMAIKAGKANSCQCDRCTNALARLIVAAADVRSIARGPQ